jgi:hypothetical protein
VKDSLAYAGERVFGAALDEEQARTWSIVREVQMGLSAIDNDDAGGLTKSIAIVKAMQSG